MENQKKCPQCGVNFEGRANKVYCSDKCKMAAFQSQQQGKEAETETTSLGGEGFPKVQKTFSKEGNTAEVLKLQIELRKLELEHQKVLAELASAEKQRERDFELKKMQLTFEQEKKDLQQEIESLQKLSSAVLVENGVQQPLEEVKQLASNFNETERKYDEEEDDDSEEDEDDEEEEINLPHSLQKRFKTFVQHYLALHNKLLTEEEAQKVLKVVKEIQAAVEAFADESDLSPHQWKEYRILLGIHQNLQQVMTYFKNRFFFESNTYKLKLQEKWYKMLKESVESK